MLSIIPLAALNWLVGKYLQSDLGFHMIPFFRPYSENVISSVLTMLIELIVIAFFFGLMLNYFSQMEPIKSQDLASLIAFTAIFIMYCLTIPRESQAAAKYFNHLLN